jgi:UTP--glucose-1-phosphate uridylyltransferase
MSFDWDKIEGELRELTKGLEGVDLDRERIEKVAREIRSGRLGREGNRISGEPEPPLPDDVDDLANLTAPVRQQFLETGREALERGEVAVAVLNGGMATRFGGGVKGIVDAIDGRSFLELKRAQALRYERVPFLVMTSFATHRATLRYLEEHRLGDGVFPFMQFVSLRLTPEGELFRDGHGRISPYAPGHGDFPDALRKAGLLSELQRRRVRVLLLSNVDNLGADPDPIVVGYHLSQGRPLTVEVAPSVPHDAGGGPARLGGRLQILESFRLPPRFDLGSLPYVNTNTLLLSPSVLAREHPLDWFYVEKNVDGRVAVQMERLVGQISAFVEAAFLGVAREGHEFRYFPIKTPDDLETLRADPVRVRRIRASVGKPERL